MSIDNDYIDWLKKEYGFDDMSGFEKLLAKRAWQVAQADQAATIAQLQLDLARMRELLGLCKLDLLDSNRNGFKRGYTTLGMINKALATQPTEDDDTIEIDESLYLNGQKKEFNSNNCDNT